MGETLMDSDSSLVYNAIYGDGHFEKVQLGELINKGGAAGKIYLDASHPGSVAKIFHNRNKSATNRKKLEAMLLNRPNFPRITKDENGVERVQIAWPDAILEDENGFCVGYLMPMINMSEAVSLDHLMQKAIRAKLGLPEKYAYRVFAAYNVAAMVAAMHKCGHYIVDLKPSNVSVYKDTMTVAMVDCDGFSIRGENDNRYPAEFVSEEYIYPEGMDLGCEEMGEEQDKFALAVIIFKLLNNGIHPFSGIPRKNDEQMLTIQNRIEEYHYAYGLWPDTYQAPHPYSIHEYFDKKTLELFERAFVKDEERPTAKEWQEHLWGLMHNLKPCKKNPNHFYFTAKGCGLCVAEEKFKGTLNNVKKQAQTPQMVRGMEISTLSVEHLQKDKAEKIQLNHKLNRIAAGGIVVYLLFFALLYPMLEPIEKNIQAMGLGIQAIVTTFLMLGINSALHLLSPKFPLLQNKALTQMLQVYAFICILIVLVSLNNLPEGIFSLAL